MGQTQISNGIFSNSALRSQFQFLDYKIEGGLELGIKNNKPHFISAFDFIASKTVQFKEIPFEIKAYLMYNQFSNLLYESNVGVRTSFNKLQHWHLEIGSNFKTYTIVPSARKKYEISETDRRISENFNLIYQFSAYLKPHVHSWNIGISMTNIDYFIINQPTNPVFNLRAKYCSNKKLTWNLETWYKPAGVFNIYAQYFGYFVRGGVEWKI